MLGVAGNFLTAELGKIPEVQSNYGGLAEINQGDSSVALSRCEWPPQFKAPHQNFGLSHMEALVHQPLQEAVLAVIRS